jgi:hypothetical protein
LLVEYSEHAVKNLKHDLQKFQCLQCVLEDHRPLLKMGSLHDASANIARTDCNFALCIRGQQITSISLLGLWGRVAAEPKVAIAQWRKRARAHVRCS